MGIGESRILQKLAFRTLNLLLETHSFEEIEPSSVNSPSISSFYKDGMTLLFRTNMLANTLLDHLAHKGVMVFSL